MEKPANTPSKLRPPKAINIGPDLDVQNEPSNTIIEGRSTAQKRRLNSPPKTKATLPNAIPVPVISGDQMVTAYKTSASMTGRPAPVTKPISRAPPRTAATGRPQIPKSSYNAADTVGHRPGWDKKVKVRMI